MTGHYHDVLDTGLLRNAFHSFISNDTSEADVET